ncbi:MAG TPA: type II toxin-antitoxin system PemK/MazF family toxin [Alphaproteobacteria bacterium]
MARSGRQAATRYQPDRGHFIYLNFSPQAGHEQAFARPGLVLSPKSFNVATNFALVCPITNQAKGRPFDVPIPPGGKITGVVLSDQLRSLDWVARNAKFHSQAPEQLVLEVLARIEAVLRIDLGQ